MGFSANPEMLIDLNTLMIPHELDDLVLPFMNEEMHEIAKNSPLARPLT
jgi:hypothetical protein